MFRVVINEAVGRKVAGVKKPSTPAAVEQDLPVSYSYSSGSDYENGFTVHAKVGGKEVGSFKYALDEERNPSHSVQVQPAYQGRGIGKMLLVHAIYKAGQVDLGFQTDMRGITKAQQAVYDSLEKDGYIQHKGLGVHVLTGKGESLVEES
jgi:GNAT superfamily N-acetyltransferase